ncbi:mitochondrial uncoupling protein 2-like [Notothenia coriiceps]|uniref:Mitochondrial uncoupling protein 2-like n=1 Tax=Notothenia coriiceps TaxID=8208 RepID=A0A6I9Q5E3_9TELE|nr:PREDICTED: mitochondrial uncoupling protein 2-like [Notothenia coriiceps]
MVGGGSADLAPSVAVKIFSAGAAGCVADLVTFPLDTAKVRLQIQGESTPSLKGQRMKFRGVFGTIFTMVKTEGPRSLYSGLVAGLHRQMSFASVRIGLYDSMKQFYSRGSESMFPSVNRRSTNQCSSFHHLFWPAVANKNDFWDHLQDAFVQGCSNCFIKGPLVNFIQGPDKCQ